MLTATLLVAANVALWALVLWNWTRPRKPLLKSFVSELIYFSDCVMGLLLIAGLAMLIYA